MTRDELNIHGVGVSSISVEALDKQAVNSYYDFWIRSPISFNELYEPRVRIPGFESEEIERDTTKVNPLDDQ